MLWLYDPCKPYTLSIGSTLVSSLTKCTFLGSGTLPNLYTLCASGYTGTHCSVFRISDILMVTAFLL